MWFREFPSRVRSRVGFQGQGGVGSAMRVTTVGQTGRDQTNSPQGEPTFRKGNGIEGGGKGGGIPGAGVGCGNRVRFGGVSESEGGSGGAGRRVGFRILCLWGLFFHKGTRHLMR